MDSVHRQIEDRIKAEEANTQASQLAETIKQKLSSGMDALQLSQMYHLTWIKIDYVGRYSNKVDTAILDTAFQMPKPNKTTNMRVYSTVRVPSGYAVVALSDVKEGGLLENKQYNIFSEQAQNSEGALEYELYQQSMMKQAKIEMREK